MGTNSKADKIGLFQGCYYIVTAIWPLVAIDSFQFVTGPKTDLWLVYTVASLILVIGTAILCGHGSPIGLQRSVIGCGPAAALMVCDVVFVSRGIISPIYLGDAVLELAIIVFWIAAVRHSHRAQHRPG